LEIKMKKLLGILVLGLILFIETAEAGKKTTFKRGQTYEGEVVWSSKVKIFLPAGEWQVAEKWSWTYNALIAGQVVLMLEENNIVNGIVLVGEVAGNGKWMAHVSRVVYEILYKNKYDGCYKRPEYFLLKNFKKGTSHNCLIVNHMDTQRDIYNSDDPFAKSYTAAIRKWVRDKNAKLPPIMLCSDHAYFAPVVKDTLYQVIYCANPELDGPKINFFTEEASEYYPPNINNFPEHRKFMEKWVGISAERHRLFENGIGALPHHKLDLSKYGKAESNKQTSASQTISTQEKPINIVDQLNKLKELYKEGALNKEEFEKAKEILLK